MVGSGHRDARWLAVHRPECGSPVLGHRLRGQRDDVRNACGNHDVGCDPEPVESLDGVVRSGPQGGRARPLGLREGKRRLSLLPDSRPVRRRRGAVGARREARRGKNRRAERGEGGRVPRGRWVGVVAVGHVHAHGVRRGMERRRADVGLSMPRLAVQADRRGDLRARGGAAVGGRLTRGAVPQATAHADINAVVAGYLRDLAFAQSSEQKMFGYKRAASAILALDLPLTELIQADGTLPRISGIGPGSTRVIREVLEHGTSATVEQAVEHSGRRQDIERRRSLRRHFLSRAEVRRVLADPSLDGPTLEQYGGDLQMHSEWSDGSPTMQEIADACVARGYRFAAVTDHSHGLKIAGGMSMEDAADQRRAIDEVNASSRGPFRLLQGIEANISGDGALDLTPGEAATFDLVLAAPHSRLRKDDDQTGRMLTAIALPAVRILAHPRGRISGSRAGV